MATTIRPVLSEKNKYYIDKHRYYELKHFCLQYQEWKKEYSTLDGYDSYNVGLGVKTSDISDRTADYGITRAYYSNRIDMIERVARLTNLELSFYILKGVTEGYSYDILKARFNLPCCKDVYYELYRRFFWLLDIERQ
ncbi:hypothetical protein [uncultured Eubacterium sp.]|uniref:hypothetical protein n=1 Tax=uncultured Eubacterium sp. TaxID=165185 RepID=UPI0025F4A604|nr:hypothetical protein [uncultured Eubacterium sp.]